jgi:lysophospholipase L1-like esterase
MKKTNFALMVAACLCLAANTTPAQLRILPLGDSVTSSFAPHDSYRFWLDHYLHAAGIDFDFVGNQSGVADGSPADEDFDQDYSGGPGWTTDTALGALGALKATDPDIVLLDLGANDIGSMDLQTTKNNIRAIIDGFRSVNSHVIILLAQPTPSTDISNKKMKRLNRALGFVARTYDVPGSPVIAVNLFSGFSAHDDTFDGTHPNSRGERIIARKFFEVLRRVAR